MYTCPLVIVFAVLSVLFADQADAASVVILEKTPSVKVRSEPRVTSPSIDQLRPTDRVELVENVDRWRKIKLNDGRIGFVSRRWTRVISDLPPRQTTQLRIHFLPIGAGTCTVVECPGANASH